MGNFYILELRILESCDELPPPPLRVSDIVLVSKIGSVGVSCDGVSECCILTRENYSEAYYEDYSADPGDSLLIRSRNCHRRGWSFCLTAARNMAKSWLNATCHAKPKLGQT